VLRELAPGRVPGVPDVACEFALVVDHRDVVFVDADAVAISMGVGAVAEGVVVAGAVCVGLAAVGGLAAVVVLACEEARADAR